MRAEADPGVPSCHVSPSDRRATASRMGSHASDGAPGAHPIFFQLVPIIYLSKCARNRRAAVRSGLIYLSKCAKNRRAAVRSGPTWGLGTVHAGPRVLFKWGCILFKWDPRGARVLFNWGLRIKYI